MYGENPFLIVNNKLFFNSCQSPILIFQNTAIGIFNTWGSFVPLNYLIVWGTDDAKTAAGEAKPMSWHSPCLLLQRGTATMLKGIYQIVQHYFLRPAPNAVHFLEPTEPVIGFKPLRHSLFLCHLSYKPVHHLITFFINFRKMLP